MKPYRPELMIFKSPDNKMELRSPLNGKTTLVKKGIFKDKTNEWPNKIHVEYVFSDPTSSRIITIGGLGDSGLSLGVVNFYTFEGAQTVIQLKDSLPEIEQLSRDSSLFGNFPWVSAIDIGDTDLKIWICEKKLATIRFSGLLVSISDQRSKVDWPSESEKQIVSGRAERWQWKLSKNK